MVLLVLRRNGNHYLYPKLRQLTPHTVFTAVNKFFLNSKEREALFIKTAVGFETRLEPHRVINLRVSYSDVTLTSFTVR